MIKVKSETSTGCHVATTSRIVGIEWRSIVFRTTTTIQNIEILSYVLVMASVYMHAHYHHRVSRGNIAVPGILINAF